MRKKPLVNLLQESRVVNQVKPCGGTIIEQYVVSKILRSLTSRFDNIVVIIKESKDLSTMTQEEWQSSLEAHEQRMGERNIGKAKAKITSQTHFVGRDNKVKGKWTMNRGRGNYQNNGGRNSQNSNNSTFKRVKAVTTKVMDQVITKVEIIEKEEGGRKLIRSMSNATIVKILDILGI